MNRHGFARISVCSPIVSVGNPKKNMNNIIAMLSYNDVETSDVVVFPELCVTGYTCGDLFRQSRLLEVCEEEILRLELECQKRNQLVIVGAPVAVGNRLYNCAFIINHTKTLGIIPKTNIPNYNEFYESRWFRGADGSEPKEIIFNSLRVPFGTDILFKWRVHNIDMIVGVEICEDLWMPIPPSSYQSLSGANVLVNLSASNETVAKNEYRTQLVANQSGRCVAAYAYASAGPSESTSDLVFGGHCLITENGHVIQESNRVGNVDLPMNLNERIATTDVDIQKLNNERRLLSSFGEASKQNKEYRVIPFVAKGDLQGLKRKVDGRPFVPKDPRGLAARCAEVFGNQCAGLAKRLQVVGMPNMYIGVSGGLDSTLALLVAAKTCKMLGIQSEKITGITMPGYGTTEKTKNNATNLMELLGISTTTVDIRELALQTFKSIHHDPFGLGLFHSSVDLDKYTVECFEDTLKGMHADKDHPGLKKGDLVFENVQARLRTFILFSKGFVIGTGDMSELALGWCTYNGDHMSSYNPNCSIPKTLVKWMVRYVAETQVGELCKKADQSKLQNTLMDICNTVISPELLPPDATGKITQSTEDVLGPYDLHDFYLVNFVRYGFSPEKILFLSDHADFGREYPRDLREKTLKTFMKRFFANQFKRDCVPDGPKVGSVSLSPRGDWRMPSDADPSIWMEDK